MATGSYHWLLEDTTADVTAELFFDEARKIYKTTGIVAHGWDDVQVSTDLQVGQLERERDE